MSKITVLGLGAMGSRMAANYASAGHQVTVWNRTSTIAEQFATTHNTEVADTPSSAAEGADFVVSMVSNDEAAINVWLDPDNGALAAMRSGSIGIESSTLTPDTVRRLGDAANATDVQFVEAPVVGSRPQAEACTLFYVLGGETAAIDSARPIIDINAANTTHAGKLGDAATMKLAINCLFAAQVAAYAEIVGFIEQSDLDTAASLATLTALPITSPALQRILGLISEQNYEPNFPVRLVAKDLAYLVDTASALGAKLPIAESAKTVFEQGANGDERDLDIAGIARAYQAQ